MTSIDHIPADVAADEPAREAERQRKGKHEANVEDDDMRWLMSHKQGRRAVWRLLLDCGIDRDPWSSNGLVMSKQCGAQAVGHRLREFIQRVSPDRYVAMVKENQ